MCLEAHIVCIWTCLSSSPVHGSLVVHAPADQIALLVQHLHQLAVGRATVHLTAWHRESS